MASQVIRYALFMEYKKKTMNRGNIVAAGEPSHIDTVVNPDDSLSLTWPIIQQSPFCG